MSAPEISVVMGVFNDAERLPPTLDSILSQTFGGFELIVVNDGSTDPRTARILSEVSARDPRIRVMSKPNEGLTRALRDGCAAARGRFIARVDAGDAMRGDRLAKQLDALERAPQAVLATCWTAFCGPDWEPLWTEKGRPTPDEGARAEPDEPGANLLHGPTSHVSAFFRRSAYEAAGGYRPQFYYGQDWDLWYRLAGLGLFRMVPEALQRVRLFPDSLSALHRERQERIGRCSLEAYWLRRAGRDESACLEAASRLRPGASSGSPPRRGEGAHFIGELLRRRGDPGCRRYFRQALRSNPFRANTWLRLAQAARLKSAGGGA